VYSCPRRCLQNLVCNLWTFLPVSMVFGNLNYFIGILLNQKEKKKMKSGIGLGFRPKTIVSGCDVRRRPAVAPGCHGVAAHRAAWPDRRGDPQCACGGRWGTVTAIEAGAVARAVMAHRQLAYRRVEGKGMRNGAAHRGGWASVR
jgi:hypothetical protein